MRVCLRASLDLNKCTTIIYHQLVVVFLQFIIIKLTILQLVITRRLLIQKVAMLHKIRVSILEVIISQIVSYWETVTKEEVKIKK